MGHQNLCSSVIISVVGKVDRKHQVSDIGEHSEENTKGQCNDHGDQDSNLCAGVVPRASGLQPT